MSFNPDFSFNHHIKEKMANTVKGIEVMVMCFLINQMTKVYVKKLRLFNAMLLCPLLVPSKVPTSKMKLYSELGLESFELRKLWFRKLCLFFKIKKTGIPE